MKMYEASIVAVLSTHAFSLVVGTFGLTFPESIELMSKSPIPVQVQIAMIYIGAAINIVVAIFMLRGRNWARLLFVIAAGLGIPIGGQVPGLLDNRSGDALGVELSGVIW